MMQIELKRVSDHVVVRAFALGPVARAARAYKDQVESVFRRLSEDDGLVMAAPLAFDSLASLEGRVFDALRVNLDVLRAHREVSPVHAVVHLIVLLCSLVAIAKLAFEL
jgi:hypothetical protein